MCLIALCWANLEAEQDLAVAESANPQFGLPGFGGGLPGFGGGFPGFGGGFPGRGGGFGGRGGGFGRRHHRHRGGMT